MVFVSNPCVWCNNPAPRPRRAIVVATRQTIPSPSPHNAIVVAMQQWLWGRKLRKTTQRCCLATHGVFLATIVCGATTSANTHGAIVVVVHQLDLGARNTPHILMVFFSNPMVCVSNPCVLRNKPVPVAPWCHFCCHATVAVGLENAQDKPAVFF